MTSRAKRDPSVPVLSAWRSGLVLFCALLFGAFSTAQAAHIHRGTAGAQQMLVHVPGIASQAEDEQLCPLCTAAQSVLPAMQPVPLGTLSVLAAVSFSAPPQPYGEVWHFARFGRPPPPCKNV